MQRSVDIWVDRNSWPASRLPSPGLLTTTGALQINIDQALLTIGQMTRLPGIRGLQLADFWPWLRYFTAVDSQNALALRAEWDELDPHQKTILSDDWGIGFTTLFVTNALDVRIWGHTLHTVRQLDPSLVRPRATRKRGPRKSPDYLGLDANWRFVVLECKGTQSSRQYSARQVQDALAQKRAIVFSPRVVVRERLAAGLFIPVLGHNQRARILVRDPEAKPRYQLTAFTQEAIAQAVCRSELSRLLPLAGAPNSAMIFDGQISAAPQVLPPGVHLELKSLAELPDRPGYRGLFREYRLPANVIETPEGAATRLRVSYGVADTTITMLTGRRSLKDNVMDLIELARQTPIEPHERVGVARVHDAEPVKPRQKWPNVSERITSTGFLVRVEWLV